MKMASDRLAQATLFELFCFLFNPVRASGCCLWCWWRRCYVGDVTCVCSHESACVRVSICISACDVCDIENLYVCVCTLLVLYVCISVSMSVCLSVGQSVCATNVR